jgi:PAS domain S-box-containing protein
MARMTAPGQTWSRHATTLGVLAAIYLVGTQAVFFAPPGSAVAAWWPGAGLAVALLALSPRSTRTVLAPAVLLVTAAANASGGRPLELALLFGVANAAEAVVAATVLQRGRQGLPRLETLDDFWRLLVAALAGAVTIATLAAVAVGLLEGTGVAAVWPSVFASHAAATLVVVPVGMSLDDGRRLGRYGELVLQAMSLLAVTFFVFAPDQSLPLAFAPLPLLVWAALRFDVRVVAWELLVTSVICTALTARGFGPFAAAIDHGGTSPAAAAAMVQVWIFSAALMWLPLTIAVEQRRQLLAQVTAREQLFRRNFTESLVGMLLLRRRGDRLEIVDANDAALRLLGGTGPLVGRYLDRVLDDPDAVRGRTQDMLLGELDGWSAQIGVAQQPGVRLNVAISMISGGPDPAFAAQLLDVTPETRARARIEAAEKLTNTTIDTTAAIIIVTDLEGTVLRVNAAVTSLTGFREDELLGRPVWTHITPEHRLELVQDMFALADGSLVPPSREAEVQRRDGSLMRVVWNNTVVRDEHGRPSMVVFTGIDVTRERHAAGLVTHLLQASKATALVGTDAGGLVTLFSAGAQRLLGYTAEEVVGRPFVSFLDPGELAARTATADRPLSFAALAAQIGPHGETQPRDWTWLAKDGGRPAVSMTLSRSSEEGTAERSYLLVGRDVTEQRHGQEMLVKALDTERTAVERLRKLDHAKNEFVSTVSHELRTPVTSIIGYTEMLRDGSVAEPLPEQVALLETIARNGERLTVICNDLLLLGGLDSGATQLERSAVDLTELAAHAADALHPVVDGRDLHLAVVRCDAPVTVLGDPVQLERVITNLLSNAVKFTEDGGLVELRLERDLDADEACVVVRDTGIGIPEGEQPGLFEKFFRSSTAQERAIPGTGLGLSIVAGIVGSHGGRIAVDSAHLAGTTFTVRLPLHRAPAAATPLRPDSLRPDAATAETAEAEAV